MSQRVRIDCGANHGHVLEAAICALPGFQHIAIEANPSLIPSLHSVQVRHPGVAIEVHHAAVWTHDGTVDFFLTHPEDDPTLEGATLLPGKSTGGVNYAAPLTIPAIDFDRFLRARFAPGDMLVVKMDIEGAEYDVLERLLGSGSIALISSLLIETHAHKIPSIGQARHDALIARLHATFGKPFYRDRKHIAWAKPGAPSPALHICAA